MQTYLIAKARNTRTRQTVKQQDLAGLRFALHQRDLAQLTADQLANSMSRRSRDLWQGFVEEYTVAKRP
jgi:hypothetical protein